MKRGILFAGMVALVASTTVTSCRRAADPQQLATVDSLINALEAARLTLNELDTQRYAKADSILQATRARFLQRFNDTLAKDAATTLGDQFVQLREANRRGADHRNVHRSVVGAGIRLKKLRNDVSVSALNEQDVVAALATERLAAEAIEGAVLQVIANYQATQRVLDRQPLVDSLLIDTLSERRTPR
jgi:hypothetical protein